MANFSDLEFKMPEFVVGLIVWVGVIALALIASFVWDKISS